MIKLEGACANGTPSKGSSISDVEGIYSCGRHLKRDGGGEAKCTARDLNA